jgi:hypothetical protein
MPQTQLLASIALTADRRSAVLDCGSARLAEFTLTGVETGTPVAVIKVEGSDDPRVELDRLRGTTTATWVEQEIPEGAVHGLGSGQAWSAGTVTWNGAAALAIKLQLEHPTRYMRVFFDYTSGGSAASLVTTRGSKRS